MARISDFPSPGTFKSTDYLVPMSQTGAGDYAVSPDLLRGHYFLTPEEFGVVSGSQIQAVRQANLTNFNTAIAFCASSNYMLRLSDRIYQIEGATGIIVNDNIRIVGCIGTTIQQFSNNAPILHVGPAIGSAGTIQVSKVEIYGLTLTYNATQALANSSANALELVNCLFCRFVNIDIGDTSNVIAVNRGIWSDATASDAFCTSNVFEHIRIKTFTNVAISLNRGAGNLFNNIHISNGSVGAQGTASNAIALQNMTQDSFNQVYIAYTKVPSVIWLNSSFSQVFNSVLLENNSLTSTLAFVQITNAGGSFNGIALNGSVVNSANGATTAAAFSLADNCFVNVSSCRIEATSKTTATFYLVKSESSSPGNVNSRITFSALRLAGALLDGYDNYVINNETGGGSNRFSPILSLDNVKGPNDDITKIGDVTTTFYGFTFPNEVYYTTPLTTGRTLTLSNVNASGGTLEVPRGCKVRVIRSAAATGAFNLVINNHNATALKTLTAASQWADFTYDGTNWLETASGTL